MSQDEQRAKVAKAAGVMIAIMAAGCSTVEEVDRKATAAIVTILEEEYQRGYEAGLEAAELAAYGVNSVTAHDCEQVAAAIRALPRKG